MMLLARAITQKFSTPTNNNFRISSNTRNQAVVQDGRVDIQTKNACYGGNANKNAGRQNRNPMFKARNGSDESNQILTAALMLMARLQLTDDNAENAPSYDAKAVSKLERELRTDKNTIERIMKEKDQIQSDFFKIENEKIIIQHETQLAKKAFKERENWYLEDIVDLEEKLSSHDRIVYKMGQSIQTIHILGKKPNKVYDPFLKAGLGYQNPERLKKAIAAQPKLYNGDSLHSANLIIDSPDLEETLEDAEESRLKMRNKMVQINYSKLNALYEIFVPQQEFSAEQTYFSIPSTSNNGYESKEKNNLLKDEHEKSSSDIKDIQANLLKRIKILENDFKRSQAQSINFELKLQHQKEKMACDVSWKSKLSTLNDENVLLKTQVESVVQERENIKLEFQKLFNSIKATRSQNQKEIDELIENVNQKTYAYAHVRAQNQDLLMTIFEPKNKLRRIEKGKNVNTKFDKSKTLGKLVCVTPFNKTLANKAKNVSNTKVPSDRSKPVTSQSTPKTEQSQKNNENVIARGMYKITKQETKTPDSKANIKFSNSTGVESSNSVRRPKSKDTKSKNSVLKNTKSSSIYVWKTSSSASIDSNKCESKDSNVCQTNARVSNSKTVNAYVNVVNDGSNIVCISYGKDVFLHSHEKCVACHALSRNSSVKRALFHSPVAAKSKNLGATFVVAKSRLSVAKTPTATNKVIQLVLWIVDSGCSKHMTGNLQLLRNFIKKFMGTVRFGNDHFATITRYGDYVRQSHDMSFMWDEAIATACFTQNCSIVHTRHNKTPYELIRGMEPNIQYFYVFGSICYPTNDRDDLGKMKPKADIGIFIGYSESSRGFQYYATSSQEVSANSAANTLDNENTSSSSSIVVEQDDASKSKTPVTTQKWVAKLSTVQSAFVSCDAEISLRNSWEQSASGMIISLQSLDMEIMFKEISQYVMYITLKALNLKGDDLHTRSRDSNLYTISISEMAASSPVCLMSRATSTKSLLGHRRLSHLNFGTINQLTSHDLVDGLPKFKYNKDHLCSACEQGKSKKASLPPKLVPSTESKLELLHMDLCGPMRVASINGKKYILVIVDDYSWYTWVYFLRTKDEAPDMIIDFNNQV
ncbi:retrovirus-related pol polyprotein from transposon TNT 1-94 [Tanacetum coccineum]